MLYRKKIVDEMTKLESLTIDEFFKRVQINYQDYEDTLQATMAEPGYHQKRGISEMIINSYNSTLFKLWRANLDIQYVLDPYACAR